MALQRAPEPFVWGKGGQRRTPDEAARDRQMAAYLLQKAGDTSPVGHWTQGAARLVDAWGGVMALRRAEASEAASGAEDRRLATGLEGYLQDRPAGPFFRGSTAFSSPASSPYSPAAVPATGGMGEAFSQTAPRLIGDLMNDFGLSREVAAGITGPLAHESEGLQAINEREPLVPGSRGGFGFAQWTGDRRDQFDAWVAENGLDPNSYEANYGFLKHELANTPEGRVLTSLEGVTDPLQAGRIFTDTFLRPGIPGYESRDRWTERAMALAPVAGPVQVASLDPSAGMGQTRPYDGPPLYDDNPVTGIAPVGMPGATATQDAGIADFHRRNGSTPVQYGGAPTASAAIAQSLTTPAAPLASAPRQDAGRQIAQALVPADPWAGLRTPTAATGATPAGSINPAIIEALTSPHASDGTRAMARALFDQEMQRADPMYQMQMQAAQQGLMKGALEIDALRNPTVKPIEVNGRLVDPTTGRVLADYSDPNTATVGNTVVDLSTGQPIYQGAPEPTATMRDYDAYAADETAAGRQPLSRLEYEQAVRRAGATNITQTTGGNSSKFIEESDKAAAGRINEIVSAGNAAPQFLGDIQQLADLGRQINTGLGAQVMTRLGPYAEAFGVDIEGLGPAQAYQSIVSRLAPQMRPAGSGASSDFDARQFLMSLPTIGNTPEGNQIITDTFQAIAENKIQAAEIASLALIPEEQGGISWQEAERQIRALPNPYARFKEMQRGAAASSEANRGTGGLVQPGQIEDGHRFKGGDRSDPANWERVN